jgi:hypothetical protein
MKKILTILIISTMLISSIASVSAYVDVESGKIYIDRTTAYAWSITAHFYDAEGKEIQEGYIKDHGSNDIKYDIPKNAATMSIDVGAYVCGDRKAHFNSVVAQACSFDMRGLLGSTARTEYQFEDGTKGKWAWY